MPEHDEILKLALFGFGFNAGFQTWFKLLSEFHDLARNALDSYVDQGYAELESIEIRPIVFRKGNQDLGDRLGHSEYLKTIDPTKIKQAFIKSRRNLFVSRVEFLLRTPEADKLRRCASCSNRCTQNIYIAKRTGQRYCSATCRTREAVRAKRLRDRPRRLKKQQRQRRAQMLKYPKR
jgi:hypothetical protein